MSLFSWFQKFVGRLLLLLVRIVLLLQVTILFQPVQCFQLFDDEIATRKVLLNLLWIRFVLVLLKGSVAPVTEVLVPQWIVTTVVEKLWGNKKRRNENLQAEAY